MRKVTMGWLKPIAVFMVLALGASSAMAALSKQDENLIYESNFGEAAQVRKLLDNGANPDARDAEGWPAVSLAAMRSDEEGMKIVRMLVDAGVNLNVRDANDETPLMNAITNNNAPMVKYMIEHGADFRAINKTGRDVLGFAKHYASDNVVDLVREAIRLEEERIREGKSRKHLYRMLDDFVYYNCALQYITYNQQTSLYTADKSAEMDVYLKKVNDRIGNAFVELQYNFKMSDHSLERIAETTHEMIFKELENLISNRHRLSRGVGTNKDLDKRCQAILASWQDTFEEHEQEQQRLRESMGR